MPIESIPTGKALSRRRKNGEANWPHPEKDGDRILPIALPRVDQRFSLSRKDKIFCIGSCFAREIEKHLDRTGFDVLSLGISMPDNLTTDLTENAYKNKYTVSSIENELTRALEPDVFRAEDCLVESTGGKFSDQQLSGSRHVAPYDEIMAVRHAVEENFRRISDADVVVLTLGLSEAFRDLETGLLYNKIPPLRTLKQNPERFSVEVLDYPQTITALENIYSLLRRNLKPGFRVLLTVSPVPLHTTFRDQDVMVANSYSKAVLRAATDDFVRDKPNVTYFPSFEMVNLSAPEAAWDMTDYRHVHRDFVEIIMTHALMSLGEEVRAEMADRRYLAILRTLIRIEKWDEIFDGERPTISDPQLAKQIDREYARARKLMRAQRNNSRKNSQREPWGLERWLVEKYGNAGQKKKLRANRAAFFEDSKSAAVRFYGRLTR